MAVMALDVYTETRDFFLGALRPMWARKDTALTLLKSAPNIVNGTANYSDPWDSATNPPLPWLYEYQYPTDCVVPLQIKMTPVFLPEWRPRVKPFRVTSGQRAILTNVPSAILIYVAQITDPDAWYEDFTELLIEGLAKKFVVPQQRGQNADPSS